MCFDGCVLMARTNSWMGDNQLPLADLDTENSVVVQVLNNWIKEFVQEFSVDGLRIDGKCLVC